MSEQVVAVPDSPDWEPNAPHARLLVDDFGHVALSLRAHPDDPDTRTVTIVWARAFRAQMGYPNDEGRQDHPLYAHGLDRLLWMGEILGSQSRHGLRRWILPLKETVVEVEARGWAVARLEGPTETAVGHAKRLRWDGVEYVFSE